MRKYDFKNIDMLLAWKALYLHKKLNKNNLEYLAVTKEGFAALNILSDKSSDTKRWNKNGVRYKLIWKTIWI